MIELKDVAIIDFNFMPGLKGPEIKAMAQFLFEGIEHAQIVWIELLPKEQEILTQVARMIEHRFLAKETPLPEPVKRQIGFEIPNKS